MTLRAAEAPGLKPSLSSASAWTSEIFLAERTSLRGTNPEAFSSRTFFAMNLRRDCREGSAESTWSLLEYSSRACLPLGVSSSWSPTLESSWQKASTFSSEFSERSSWQGGREGDFVRGKGKWKGKVGAVDLDASVHNFLWNHFLLVELPNEADVPQSPQLHQFLFLLHFGHLIHHPSLPFIITAIIP